MLWDWEDEVGILVEGKERGWGLGGIHDGFMIWVM